ncbi:unnamed protein product, partial [Owenia fusiformis]
VCTEKANFLLANITDSSSVDQDYNSICEAILATAEKTLKKKKTSKYSKGWWCPELTKKLKEVRKAKRNFNKRSDPNNWDKYSKLANEFTKMADLYKDQYWYNLFKQLDSKNTDKMWKVVKNYNKSGTTKPSVQPLIRKDGSFAITDSEIANEFLVKYGKEELSICNKNWQSQIEIGSKLAVNLEKLEISLPNYSSDCSIENKDLNIGELITAINKSNSLSAPDPREKIFYI